MMVENVDLHWIRSVLQTTPERWLKLVEALPLALLERPPAAGEWSALSCLQHLTDTERLVFPVRVQYFLAGQDFPAFDPDSGGSDPQMKQSPGALADSFAQLRQQSLAQFDQITVSDLERQARHAQLGVVTLSMHLHEWAAHDLMHTVQAERALMQPFINACGPWQPLFSDHWVDAEKS